MRKAYLDKLWVLTANAKTFLDRVDVPLRRPNDVLGAFDDDAIASKDGSKNGRECIMKGWEVMNK